MSRVISTKSQVSVTGISNSSRYQTGDSHSGGICTRGIKMGCISIAKTLPLFPHKHPQKTYIGNKALMKEKEVRSNLWLYTIPKKNQM